MVVVVRVVVVVAAIPVCGKLGVSTVVRFGLGLQLFRLGEIDEVWEFERGGSGGGTNLECLQL